MNRLRRSERQSTPDLTAWPGALAPYALAVLTVGVALAVTRLSWPFFAATPFIPLFGAVLVTTHFGSGPAGLVALGLSVAGAWAAFPGSPLPMAPRAFGVYVVVSLVSNRVLVNRNRVEATLRRREAEWQAVWQYAGLGVALLDRDGRITLINAALEHLLGASSAAYAGTSFAACSDTEEQDPEAARFVSLMAGTEASYQSEHRFQQHDGTIFWGRLTVSAIRDTTGQPTGAMAILEDVSARRQAEEDLRVSEERLRRAQKLEAIGRLVAGIAHNFNNLLTVTRGYAELLLARHAEPDRDHEDLEEIRKAAERGATLARQLLTFGRRHDSRVRHIELNRVVCEFHDMLRRVLREDIRLSILPASRAATLLLDPHDVEQLLLNLVINARDAMPLGGEISIEVDVGHYSIEVGAAADVTSDEIVRLRVRDTGIGMTPEVRAHLFEPFFTTKDIGQGTGLGLAFVDGLVRHHHGAIDVTSTPEQGTTFDIYLPLVPPCAGESTASPAAAPAVVRADATILLVEDEPAVRTLTGRMLERFGYRVLTAATATDACSLFEAHARDVTLLLTDVVMPEMHGPALAQRLLAQRPDLRVLFMSGYTDGAMPTTSGTRHMAFLPKPFDSAHLLAAVETLLNAAS